MKFWQKKVRGWIVPFWYSDTPLISKRVSIILSNRKDMTAMNKALIEYRLGTGNGIFKVSKETQKLLMKINIKQQIKKAKEDDKNSNR